MSTKIYNGWRLPATTSAPALARRLETALRPIWSDLATRAVAGVAALAHLAASAPDGLDTVLAAVTHSQLSAADIYPSASLAWQAGEILDLLAERLDRPGARRVPARFDIGFSVVLLDDPAGGEHLYALTYSEQPALDAAWASTSGGEPWPYWDNTDRPDELTDAEWGRRRDVWDRVLGWDAPGRNGVHWRLEHQPLGLAMAARDTDGRLGPTRAQVAGRLTSELGPAPTGGWEEVLAGPPLANRSGSAPGGEVAS